MEEVYKSSGKIYNDEKAIISLTSWKARINTVSKTLYSLLDKCPGFHIVLVLSEEEFPQKEKELPENLMLFVNNNLVEILWVYPNYKNYKKIIFTMKKYPTVPIISADDGCIYIRNYANQLYNEWLEHKNDIITILYNNHPTAPSCGGGYGVLYPPNCFKDVGFNCIVNNDKELLKNLNDDRFIACLALLLKIKIRQVKKLKNKKTFVDVDEKGLTNTKGYIIKSNWKFINLIKSVM